MGRETTTETMIKFDYKNVLMAFAVIGMVLFSVGVSAASCTISNWSSSVGLADANAGTQGANNRRYAGPCGLRVPLAGAEAYVEDTSPVAEEIYNVRFYFFLNGVSDDVTIFKAENASGIGAISATYDDSEQKINVVFSTGAADGTTTETVNTGVVSSGWNSLEIQWASAAATKPRVILNTNEAVEPPTNLDTSNYKIDVVKLGAVLSPATIPTAGTVDFDDFDSRRETVPGRLCRGLTDTSRTILTFTDAREIFKDAVSSSYNANGQPDYDLNGAVTFADARAVFARAVSSANRDCSQNL